MSQTSGFDTEPGSAGGNAIPDIERQLDEFEVKERERLGLDDKPEHWNNKYGESFSEDERKNTTFLFGGLTKVHDTILEAGLTAAGFNAKALDCPTNDALRYGKEFGNRGQCNPTYFTVGNLVKHLSEIKEETGLSSKEVSANYVFATAGACGPCRFGSYITEYRKALGDAGFENFRVFDIRRFGAHKQDPKLAGLRLDVNFYKIFCKCIVAGDVVNAMGYRTRPYEVEPGATNEAIEECKRILCETLLRGGKVLKALRLCRKEFAKVEVNRLQPKPKVSIIGEFWAMTTEGDGNYHLQRFLEEEGAECDVQLISAWGLYEIWETGFDAKEKMMLRKRIARKQDKDSSYGNMLAAVLTQSSGSHYMTYIGSKVLDKLLRFTFQRFARAIGLEGYHLPDMERIALLSREMYPLQLRGGEGHMEVGKVIDTILRSKAHMVVSVKPFGCMPSSGVSDGVQTLVTSRYPEANFCPIETSGDGAVGVYSRVQMSLFKARSRARDEYEKVIAAKGLTIDDIRAHISRRLRSALHYPPHRAAGTATNAVYEIAGGD